MLTGNALKDFEQFYNFKYFTEIQDGIVPSFIVITSELYPFTGKSGFILEWLRSVGIWIECQRGQEVEHEYKYAMIILDKDDNILDVIQNPDYNTALTEAIKQAVNIYNGSVK